MLMKIAVNRGIGMVKQSPFQQDLFDFKYIEDQVTAIKKSIRESDKIEPEKEETNFYEEQLSLLREIRNILLEIDKNTKKKRSRFGLKK